MGVSGTAAFRIAQRLLELLKPITVADDRRGDDDDHEHGDAVDNHYEELAHRFCDAAYPSRSPHANVAEPVDVLLREHRDTASVEAFLEQALGRSGQVPSAIIADYHQPYVKAIQRTVPTAVHIRSGLHCANGLTTKAIERSHVPTRDRLRSSRGLKTLRPGQRFLEGFECLRALRRGHIQLADLLPTFSAWTSPQDHARTIAAAALGLGMRLNRKPPTCRL